MTGIENPTISKMEWNRGIFAYNEPGPDSSFTVFARMAAHAKTVSHFSEFHSRLFFHCILTG